MTKINITLQDVIHLHELAIKDDRLYMWSELAIEWMKAADAEIQRLQQLTADKP